MFFVDLKWRYCCAFWASEHLPRWADQPVAYHAHIGHPNRIFRRHAMPLTIQDYNICRCASTSSITCTPSANPGPWLRFLTRMTIDFRWHSYALAPSWMEVMTSIKWLYHALAVTSIVRIRLWLVQVYSYMHDPLTGVWAYSILIHKLAFVHFLRSHASHTSTIDIQITTEPC